MDRRAQNYWLGSCLLTLAIAAGCAGGTSPAPHIAGLRKHQAKTDVTPLPSTAADTGPLPAPPAAPSTTAANSTPPTSGPARSAEMQQILAELQTVGALDPAAQAQLMRDLQQTDPALWPQMVQLFRMSLAYRQRAQNPSNTPPTAPPSKVELATATTTATGPATANTMSAAAAANAQPIATSPPAGDANRAAQIATSVPETSPSAAGTASPPALLTSASTTAAPLAAQPAPSDANVELRRAIQALELATAEPPHTPADTARHVHLRMLYLTAGRRDDALRPIAGLSTAEQDFWNKQIYALQTYLDAERNADPQRRASDAAVHLTSALGRLSEAGNLVVRNLAFCTAVSSYGVHTDFEKYDFRAGQEVLVYCEVENFKSAETPRGHHTSFKSSYQILDAQGRQVTDHELPATDEYCQNRRRDYFIRYFVSLPQRIYGGRYTLQLTVEDQLGKKVGQSSLEFTIKGDK